MVRLSLLALFLVGGLSAVARGAPLARQRVVLADPDPELRHAMEQALAPWHLQVVIEGPPPSDAGMAQERADADTARFVVWRDGKQLVVYDRELGSLERRDSSAGVLDPPGAAAAALTIKTMMRLPPPPAPDAPPPQAPLAASPGIELRLQVGIATRFALDGDAGISGRFGGTVELRPWSTAGWRFGVAGDVGTTSTVDQAGFKGTWSEWAAFGLVGWAFERDAWELAPRVGFGLWHATLDGTESNTARTENVTLPTARVGVSARWRHAPWSVGAQADFDGIFGTQPYNKTTSGAAEIFRTPSLGLELGAVAAVDL